ncbi:protein kinase domain-containing protein [Haloplanus halophilus]|uniref:protein kinase domain-containing protein n=1 Tax=Haloplanus halophilus TaxID=2949993 RepID=UPI00203C41EA|nr:protein kinase [Haloplanus sp. GDY1]
MDRERAEALRRRAEREPESVALDTVRTGLSADDGEIRNAVAHALARVAEADAERVVDLLDALVPCLRDRNDHTRNYATFAFKRAATVDPETVGRYLGALEPRLRDGVGETRNCAADAFMEVAAAVPERVGPYLEALGPCLADDNERTRNYATFAFSGVATVDPERVAEFLDSLAPRLQDEDPKTRDCAAFAFKEVSKADAEAVGGYLAALEPALGDGRAATRNYAAFAFKEVSKVDAGAVVPHLDALAPRLGDDDGTTRHHAAFAFKQAAKADAGAVAPHVDALAPRLGDDDETIRNYATYAFGAVSEVDPERIAEYPGALASRLRDENQHTRYFAAGTLATLAESTVDPVVPHLESLVPLLGDDFADAREMARSCLATVAAARPGAVRDLFDRADPSHPAHDALESILREADLPRRIDPDRVAAARPDGDEIPSAPDVAVSRDRVIDERHIGTGGNAVVLEATVTTSAESVTVAIKRPRTSGTIHTETVERLLDEAETWAKLDDHDHVVDVVDYGADPVPWIAMEYMDGGHLGDRAADMDLPQKAWTALAVTRGVRHAHRHGVAHLDLKPDNVLFRRVDGAWDAPKVADWGLSKRLLDRSTSPAGLSPTYAAPEQFDDDYGPTDDITDIYQLGAVFYDLFTGRPPFEDEPSSATSRIPEGPPAPPSEVAPVPSELDDVLRTALATERAERYDDIVYLRDALRRVIEG